MMTLPGVACAMREGDKLGDDARSVGALDLRPQTLGIPSSRAGP